MADDYYKCLNSGSYFGCEARQYSDQIRCERCDLTWDMNDPDPPKCLQGKDLFDIQREKLKRLVNE